MESRVKSSQNVGLAVVQTRGKATHNLPQRDHHRMWMAKGPSPKGLSEIEEIENEEVSIKMMQSLERFMRSYPAVWSESSVQHLLVVESSFSHFICEFGASCGALMFTVLLELLTHGRIRRNYTFHHKRGWWSSLAPR